MSTTDLDPEDLADIVVDAIATATRPLRDRIAALEKRSAGVRWRGIFNEGAQYEEGELVTKGGSLWLCTADTRSKPGSMPAAWRLVVKKGELS